MAILGGPQLSTAQINVTTTLQDNTDPTKCSFREALYAAEFGAGIAIGSTFPDTTYSTGCTDGSGTWNNIVLQAGATYPFSRFWDGDAHNPFGPTATPIIFKTISIEGNGATLVWTGAGNARLFTVGYASFTVDGTTYSGTGNLTLRHVYIKGFHVKGGDGADGGGGGLGAGGAIYVGRVPGSAVPGLTVENSTFDSNGATGGNGGSGLGGGGGGLGGNGGKSSGAGAGGGGATGNGGNSGDASTCTPGFACDQGGGGGGGTVFSGGNGGDAGSPGSGGLNCGGTGGDSSSDGHGASCPGGGGGGGGHTLVTGDTGNGGSGKYGGGGGGGSGASSGGNGDFGGGGGSAGGDTPEAGVGCGNGGNGGFGGGGAGHGNPSCILGGGDGSGGVPFGGDGNGFYGGGGGALGGAIFNDSGTVAVQNSTFYNNFVGHGFGGGGGAHNGADAGGAIFSRNGSTTIQDVTISGNQATGSGAGVEVMTDGNTATATLVLENTIIAGNNGERECIVSGSVGTDGSTSNLVVNNGGCPSVAVTSDPLLDSLKPNVPGDTPTMALLSGSPAIGAGDSSLNVTLPTDQRGLQRKDPPDIGAYESVPMADLSLTKAVSPSTAKAGDTVTYTLTLNNLGPDAANDVAFADFLPTALTFVSCSASGGAACSSQGGFLVVSYGTIAANDPQTIAIKGTVNAGASRGAVMNQASVSDASPFDPNGSNNSSSASFTVLVPDFSVDTVSPITIVVGGSGTSTITVESIDTFSSAVKLTASGPSGFQESFSANPVTPPSNGSKSSMLTISLGPSVTAGSYTVHVTGSSGTLTHTTSVSVTVRATIAGITSVIGSFVTSGALDNSGIANSLTSKLSTAQSFVDVGDNQTAVNVLDALINQLNAQSGKHITSSAASVLITDTQALQSSLGANFRPDPVMGYVVSSSNVPIAGAIVNVLDSSNEVVATASTDGTGFYFFALTSRWTLGRSYKLGVILPKGYKTSTPTSQQFTWQASQVMLTNFVLN